MNETRDAVPNLEVRNALSHLLHHTRNVTTENRADRSGEVAVLPICGKAAARQSTRSTEVRRVAGEGAGRTGGVESYGVGLGRRSEERMSARNGSGGRRLEHTLTRTSPGAREGMGTALRAATPGFSTTRAFMVDMVCACVCV